MATYIIITAFILCWIWIELSLVLVSKLTKNQNKNNNEVNQKHRNKLSVIWYLRFIAVALLLLTFIYMQYSEDLSFKKAIQYCLGIIK